jgi:hypothetical protein
MPQQILWSEALESFGGHQGILGYCLQMIDQTKKYNSTIALMPNTHLQLSVLSSVASSLSFRASACILPPFRNASR